MSHATIRARFCQTRIGVSRVQNDQMVTRKPDNHGLLAGAVADATRSKWELMLENTSMRQQVIMLGRDKKQPSLTKWDQRLLVLLARQRRTGIRVLL